MKVCSPLLAAAGLLVIAASPAAAGEINCAAARSLAEKAVCSSELLSRLDMRMARHYGWLWAAFGDRERLALRDEQHNFHAFRDACGADKVCLRATYLTRIEDLANRLRHLTQAQHDS